MTREQEQDSNKQPLQTGERISQERSKLSMVALINLATEGEIPTTPSSLQEIQARLAKDTGYRLPEELMETLDLSSLDFVEFIDPDSIAVMFAGFDPNYPNVPGSRSLLDALAIVTLNRSDGSIWTGPASIFNGLLLPDEVFVSGINSETARILTTRYSIKKTAFGNHLTLLPFLENLSLSLKDKDGFIFKEGYQDLVPIPNTHPYELATRGVITPAMISKISATENSGHKKLLDIRSVVSEPTSYLIFNPYQGLIERPVDLELDQGKENKLKVNAKNKWHLELPRVLTKV